MKILVPTRARQFALVIACALLSSFSLNAFATALTFEISLSPKIATNALDGRLVLIISSTNRPEPRLSLDDADAHGPFAFGLDVTRFGPGKTVTVDDSATASLNHKLSQLPAGTYYVQAVLDVSTDIHTLNSGGNLASEIPELKIDAQTKSPVKLELSKVISDAPPPETEYVKFIKIQSKLLSDFHHKPMFLRAGIILPRTYATEKDRKYPLWIDIGGFATRYTRVVRKMGPMSRFRPTWLAQDTAQMIYVLPDGAGPNGDSYQINSANNGPYGDALVQELIPAIEKQFRTIGEPRGRVLGGVSTGGWVALALEIFYPDYFNGAWVSSPDPVDFTAFELVNIYEDDNAYINDYGEERPSIRALNGDIRVLMRREVQMEAVQGRGGDWTRAGGQWGSWNAVFGPRGADGKPVPIWDANGKIDHKVAEHWRKYDLRLVLEKDWDNLAPKLRGKLHIWAAEADQYYLNNAVHLLDEFLADREPKGLAEITYGSGKAHGWFSIRTSELVKRMEASTQTDPKK